MTTIKSSRNLTTRYIPKRIDNISSNKILFINVQSSIIRNSQEEENERSTDEYINVAYLCQYIMVLLREKKGMKC